MINGIGYGFASAQVQPATMQNIPAQSVSLQPASTQPVPARPLPVQPAGPVHVHNAASGHAISPYAVTNEDEAREAGLSECQIRGLKKAGQIECATCAGRMYQDGSDENVSFKSAAHVSPEAAGAAVRAHEGEHVGNAYKKAAMNNGKVMRASVSIHMAICPECGRSYVSGGTTSTSIKYYGDKSPLAAHQKSFDEAAGIKGRHIDAGV
ncbi:MAG: hypothetical protein K6E62_06240 [Lachnospiraceae bacterium]|nr:hypothetical protein [Lachnospiraceae bacterium]